MIRPALVLSVSCLAAVPATAQALGTIEANTTTKDFVRCVQSSNDGLVMTADGAMWGLVYERITSTGTGYIELRFSVDQGRTWIDNDYKVHGGQFACSSLASMSLARDGNRIHLLWSARTGQNGANQYMSVYYQAFDVASKAFAGTPELIADGYGGENQFAAESIAETGAGHLVAAITSHRRGGLGLSAWSCGLWVKKRGATTWPANGVKVNLSTGIYPAIEVVGEKIHLTMRDTTGGYGPIYRRFDADTGQFDTPVVRTWPSSQGTIVGAGNVYSFVIDDRGGKWLLWPEGVVSGNNNAALNLSYAAPGTGDAQNDWQKNELFKDAGIRGGNVSMRFYTLARTVGNSVYVFYSKPTEGYNTLYYEIWSGGKPLLPQPLALMKTTVSDRFSWLAGVRRRHNGHSPMLMSWALRTAGNSGQVDLWRLGSGGFYTVYGSGCHGGLADEPQVTGNSVPTIGSNNAMTWAGLPKSAACFLGIGLKAVTPVPLVFMGAPDCSLDIDLALPTFGGATDPQGEFVFGAAVPSLPALQGFGLQLQVLAVAVGAPGGVMTAPALGWRF